MKKEFTFAMLTYNQEQYVVEQLESIKYQVLHYGKDYKTSFLLCDDASKDRTVEIVTKWIEQENIFDSADIVVASTNGGIVSNYSTLLKNVKTERFKVLAGDDLYYKNNVYFAAEQGDYCITPLLKLHGSDVSYETNTVFFRLLKTKKNLRKYLLRYMEVANPNEAPSIFWNHRYVDEALFEAQREFKWVEDVPTFYYLLSQNDLKVKVLEEPYVLYRLDDGISLNPDHPRYQIFREEEKRLKEKYFVKQYRFIGKLNPYLFRERVISKLYRSVFNKIDYKLKRFEANMVHEAIGAKEFYADIQAKAKQWLMEN